jgi:hypothetical protein
MAVFLLEALPTDLNSIVKPPTCLSAAFSPFGSLDLLY